MGPAGASACGRRTEKGRESCSPGTAVSSRGRLIPWVPEPSAHCGPTVWMTWEFKQFIHLKSPL